MRLLLNSLDPELAERPGDLIACDGQKATREWDAFNSLVAALRELLDDQTIFMRSGKPTALYRTDADSPRLLTIDPRASDGGARQFREPGNLHRFAQACAANWFYVGSQLFLQAAYEILQRSAQVRFSGTLAGKLVASCGLGAVAAAQPLAATLHGAAALSVDPDSERVKRCVKSGYCEIMVNDIDEALRILKNSARKREPASVGLVANCNIVIPELVRRGIVPDLFFPNLFDRAASPEEIRAISGLRSMGTIPLDGETFMPDARIGENSEPLICVALSGNSSDIACADRLLGALFPANESLQNWLALARRHVRFQGLPSRIVWLLPGERHQFARAVNDAVARRELQTPVVLAGIFSRAFGLPSESFPSGGNLRPRLIAGPSYPPRQKIRSLDADSSNSPDPGLAGISLSASAGLAWASVASFGDKPNAVRRMACAIVADGTSEIAARIDRVLGPIEPREGRGHAL
jgi:urocanate hydratase